VQAEIERASRLVRYPEDWRNTTLESVAEINPESLDTQTPAAYQFRYIDIASVTSGVIDWSGVRTHRFAIAPSRARRVVRPRDVLLSTVRPGLQAHAYADWSRQEGYVCSTGFAVLRGGRAIWPRFLYHLVFSDTVTSQVRRLEVGSNYPAITETDVRWLRIPQPPLSEQRRIAEILDTADRAIGETEALIAKLKQIKTLSENLSMNLEQRRIS
jgi:type I restriction enzyme, S subunit